MANKLGGSRKVIAWDGEVKVFENGRIEGSGICREFKAGQAAQPTTAPVGSGAARSGNFVRLNSYTTKIRWGILDIDARPFENKGYWGKRITQNDSRIDAFELKINPNNESFYVEHPTSGRFVQFENLNSNTLQDGKLVLNAENSIYRVYNKPEFLRQKILDEAIRQTQAAIPKGLNVEWLVSDQIAVDHLTRLFQTNNISITVRFLAE